MDGYETTPVLGRSFYSRAAEFSQMVNDHVNIIRADNDSHCNYYRPKNSSIVILIPGGYEGIPQNLCINFVAWIVCLLQIYIYFSNNVFILFSCSA